jgi:superfamily II DNA or RNA helicase
MPSFAERVASSLQLWPHQEGAVGAILGVSDDRTYLNQICIAPGGGKTLAAAVAAQDLLAQDYRVLWVAKSWPLLQQAAETWLRLDPSFGEGLARIGGRGGDLGHLPETADRQVYFTTLQTYHARHHRLPAAVRPAHNLLLIYDEAHWALDARLGRELLGDHRGHSLLVGLTATPRADQLGLARVVYQANYAELCGTVLAEPTVREVHTGVEWRPVLHGGEFTPQSMRPLAGSDDRNDLIVTELLGGLGEGCYHSVLIFACNVKHANVLCERIAQRGVPVRVVHSRIPPAERQSHLEAFEDGRVSVVVNIDMLTEGTDIPAIDTVFLTRPTTSPTRLTQMIGRRARLAPGKSHFWVVEFTDSIRRHQDRLFHAGDLLPARDVSLRPRPVGPRPPGRRHEAPEDAPEFEILQLPPYGSLSLARNQTFGVEIELTSPDGVPRPGRAWEATGEKILNRLIDSGVSDVHPRPLRSKHGPDASRWYLVYDSSAGWEIVSPALWNPEGFAELRRACDALAALVAEEPGLTVNHRCGLHLTLAARLNADERLRGFLRRVQRLEPGLYPLTAPSRLYQFEGNAYDRRQRNPYCLPLREQLWGVDELCLRQYVADPESRYRSVGLTKAYAQVQLLEVRLHGGTTQFAKIAPWVALWMHILNRACYDWLGPSASGRVLPGGNNGIGRGKALREDLFALLRAEGIYLDPGLELWLRRRRAALKPSWRKVVPRRVRSWELAGWYDLPATGLLVPDGVTG